MYLGFARMLANSREKPSQMTFSHARLRMDFRSGCLGPLVKSNLMLAKATTFLAQIVRLCLRRAN